MEVRTFGSLASVDSWSTLTGQEHSGNTRGAADMKMHTSETPLCSGLDNRTKRVLPLQGWDAGIPIASSQLLLSVDKFLKPSSVTPM